MEMIPVFKPLLQEEERAACIETLEVGWLGMGKRVGEFEAQLKRCVSADDRYVVALSTGHAALHLGLITAGVQPGNEVITPSFNNVADFQAILAVGASPVFCDIDEQSLCIDLDKAEKLITEKTKAMIVMDYDCVLCNHDGVNAFARKHGIRIIHDAAHSFGSSYKGKPVGSFSDICMFSFDPVKTITCMDGGALVVRSEEEVRKLHAMRLVGMEQPAEIMYRNTRAWTYDVRYPGFRYHMSNMHAAVGLAQLAKIQEISHSRRKVCKYYNERFAGIHEIITPKTDFIDITPFLYYIRCGEKDRESLRKYMLEKGVDTGIHWQPGHWFTLFSNCRRGDLTVTDRVGKEILSLPLHSSMNEEDMQRVADAVCGYFGK